MDASSQPSLTSRIRDLLLSLVAGLVFALWSGTLQVQPLIGNGTVSEKFGVPIPWNETLVTWVCSGFDCVGHGRSVIHWPLLLLDVLFFVALSYLGILFYQKLASRWRKFPTS